MKDWLGQEIEVGDLILYPAGMGSHSVALVLAQVLEFREVTSEWSNTPVAKIVAQPLKATRWKNHYGRTRYIDIRTGKGIDPFAGNGKHEAKPAHYRHEITGEEISLEQQDARQRAHRPGQSWDGGYRYIPATFKDYVQKQDREVGPVVLTILENVTKWTGEVPDDLPTVQAGR